MLKSSFLILEIVEKSGSNSVYLAIFCITSCWNLRAYFYREIHLSCM